MNLHACLIFFLSPQGCHTFRCMGLSAVVEYAFT